MQAIKTKFLPHTNTKGARISAVCDAKRIVVSWDHALGRDENHVAAAYALANKLQWPFSSPRSSSRLEQGWIGNECFHVWVKDSHKEAF